MLTSPHDLTVQLQVVSTRDWDLKQFQGHAILYGSTRNDGKRLNQLFEARCRQYRRERQGHRLAVETEHESLTFEQLDRLANQTAHHLARRGVRVGDKVGLLFDRSVWAYASMLAVMKLGAVYVPMDKQFPVDRIQFIASDSEISVILSVSTHAVLLAQTGIETVFLDQARPQIERETGDKFRARRIPSGQDLCYIIYTSGSTGKPKGVPITHANICNFIEAARDIYALSPSDRMYQGLTLAFDFAVEEIWVPLISGATLVPAPSDVTLIGPDLTDFIRGQQITALCCVPTLLATVDTDLPNLTFLLVSGEACPEELANRWHAEGRRFLNVYGPTEATVSATWTELRPEGKVTIGGPLPSYSIVIIDPKAPKALPLGEVGEICIAGPGLAPGYLNRDDKTRAAFIDDFIGIENNPSGRIYRTGDLGRINEDNEVEYLGRIDTQVKIRGYRIELDEISSTLMEFPQIAQAVVIDYTTPAGVTELAAYYTRRDGAQALGDNELHDQLRDRLPPYMVPSSFQELGELPMLPSHKVDRKALPDPVKTAAPAGPVVAPVSEVESHLAEVFARVLGLPQVSTSDNFFDGMGASSLLLVHVCNELRTDPRFATVSVKDLYQYQTISELAAYLDRSGQTAAATRAAAAPRPAPHRASRTAHLVCGLLQTLWVLAGLAATSAGLAVGISWLLGADDAASALGRSFVAGPVLFVAAALVSTVLKWLLVGRWKVKRIPVWSFGYFRYWAAKGVIRANPMRFFAGSPLYNVYLRLLGAKIGRGVTILSAAVPVCTDLVRIGDYSVIRPGTTFNGCKIEDGWVITGPVTVGVRGYVGEASLLDTGSVVGTFATLGHKSCLHTGQRIPDFGTWHGSPAEPTMTNYRVVPAAGRPDTWRRVLYSAWRLASLTVGLTLTGLLTWVIFQFEGGYLDLVPVPGPVGLAKAAGLAVIATALFAAALVLGLVGMAVVPRLIGLVLKPGRTYPLYGLHYALGRIASRAGNSGFYNSLFGDSAVIVKFLRWIGYNLSPVVQTGVNFGLAQAQGTPVLCRVGSGTMVSDGMTMMNYDYSSSSFTCSRVAVPAGSFLGNDLHIPAQARLGDNCLLATKAMVPIDGQIRANTGLLGSPAFEIPRSTVAVGSINTYGDPAAKAKRLRRKLWANLWSMVGYVGSRYVLVLAAFVGYLAILLDRDGHGPVVTAALVAGWSVVMLVAGTLFAVLVEWLGLRFKRLRPRECSIYDSYYWYHERHWKLGRLVPIPLVTGTPYQPLIWRLLGVRIGKRVVDEGALIPERSLTSIGDDCCLNEGTTIQGHSLEDGIFKSDFVRIGPRCTIGVRAFVHYGTVMGPDAVLEADSFLLKGETVADRAVWSGNPAQPTAVAPVAAPSPTA